MKLTEELKAKIDNMEYRQMLSLWRFAPVGDQMFTDESGEYFADIMSKKRNSLEPGEHAQISKDIGW